MQADAQGEDGVQVGVSGVHGCVWPECVWYKKIYVQQLQILVDPFSISRLWTKL